MHPLVPLGLDWILGPDLHISKCGSGFPGNQCRRAEQLAAYYSGARGAVGGWTPCSREWLFLHTVALSVGLPDENWLVFMVSVTTQSALLKDSATTRYCFFNDLILPRSRLHLKTNNLSLDPTKTRTSLGPDINGLVPITTLLSITFIIHMSL